MVPPASARLDDFHDRLSPMLVKELRQGLRAKTFVGVFLTLQGLLAFVLLTAAGTSSQERAGATISSIIFFFFSLAVLVVQPLRGIGALHAEIKGNTIDLMVLTRLSAWRIVLGKWIAIVSQSALLLVAITPYLILRYFFGGMNLFAELLLLGMIFFLSVVATSITVGISAIPSIIVRGLAPLIGSLFILMGIFSLVFGRELGSLIEFCSLQRTEARWVVFGLLLGGSYLAWSTLGIGAMMIAPVAENHSTSRRLVSLAALMVIAIISHYTRMEEAVMVMLLFVVCAPAIVLALTEPFYLLPPVCKSFVRRGPLGIFAGRFLYPGWPCGALFTALLLGLAALIMFLGRPPYGGYSDDTILVSVAFAGMLLLPGAVLAVLEQKIRNRFTVYLLILLSSSILSLVLVALGESMSERGFLWLFSWIPLILVPMSSMGSSTFPHETLLTIGIAFAVIYGAVILIAALRHMPEIHRVEREAVNPTAP